MSLPLWVVIIIAVVVAAVCFFLGVQYRKKVAEREIMSAEEEAKRIINESIKSAESKKREALVEAKEEIHKNRSEYEREVKERRSELQKQERRLQQKEENLDKKMDAVERKSDTLNNKITAVENQQHEVALIKKSQLEMLEKISGFSVEEAKQYLIANIRDDVTHEMAMKVKEIETQYKEEAEDKARAIIATAIQRCAADHASEITVSVVPLPNDEMKGRIIGREGRNIRSIETLTGCDLIIDDTPEAITVSSFDPVRREVARLALEKLIQDGRIHPARIEEMVAKAQKEVNATIKAEGERAVFETNIHGLHPELIRLLGRMKYRTSYGQNVLNHSIEVSHIAGLMAAELGVDVATAAMSPSASISPASTRSPRQSFTPSRRTTATWSRIPSSPVLFRRQTRYPLPAPARAARISRATSSVLRSWRRSPRASPASQAPTRFRPAARSASWSSPKRSARIRWFCLPATSQRRSRTS